MSVQILGRAALATAAAGALTGSYLGLVTGAIPVDLGLGRRLRPLGPFGIDIEAPVEVVFDVLSEPYLGRENRGCLPVRAGGA